MIKSRRLRWVNHVARMEEGRSAFKILTGKNLQEKILWRGLGVDGMIILEWTLKKWVSMWGIGLIWLSTGIIGGPV